MGFKELFSHVHTRDTVHNHQGSISHTECSSYFRGEVNMSRWVNQVDQEAGTILGLLDEGHVIITQLIVEGDGTTSKNILLVKCQLYLTTVGIGNWEKFFVELLKFYYY